MFPLRRKVAEQTPAFYVQLVGVVQSIAAGVLILTLVSFNPSKNSSLELLLYGLRFAATFQLIVLVWHVHLQHVTTFQFAFGLADSYIPFLFGVVEYFLITSIGRSSSVMLTEGT